MCIARKAASLKIHFSSPASAGLGLTGMVMVTVVPFPRMLFTEILPPWASSMRLQMGKPKPMPLALVVKSGNPSLSLLKFSFVMPAPVSLKAIFTLSFAALLVIVKVPVRGMASIALVIMLANTLRMLPVSALILGLPSVASTIWILFGTSIEDKAFFSSAFGVVSANSNLSLLEYSNRSFMILLESSIAFSMACSISLPVASMHGAYLVFK